MEQSSSRPQTTRSVSSSGKTPGPRRRGRKRRRRKTAPEIPELGQPLACSSSTAFWMLRAVDLCFAALILFFPFVMGGRQAHGQLLLVILASALTGFWCAFQFIQKERVYIWSRVEWLLAAGVGLVCLQLCSLTPEQLTWLSPQVYKSLPLWRASASSSASLGVWDKISFIPQETKSGLTILIAYVLIFLVAVQRIRSQRDVERMLKLIGISGAAMAIFGIVQRFTSNGNFFWFYDNPFSTTDLVLKGAFTNRNHFAHFLALAIGPLAWWTATSMKKSAATQNQFQRTASGFRGDPAMLALLCLGFVALALLLSLSRGGALAAFAAGTVSLLAVWLAKMLSGRIALGLCGLGMLLICALMIYGEQDVQQRMDQLVSGDVEQLDESGGRRVIWNAVMRGIQDFSWLGTGIGSHREVYPMYLVEVPKHDQHEFTHAENGYLQVCLESGGIGLALVVCGFLIAMGWSISGMRQAPSSEVMLMLAAGLAVLCANLTHSATDFVWYCPACVVIVVLIAACLCRTKQMVRSHRGGHSGMRFMPVSVWVTCLVGTGCLAAWMVNVRMPYVMAESHWHDYMRLATALVPDEDKTEAEDLRARLLALTAAERANPNHARTHLRLGMSYRQLFLLVQMNSDNPMELSHFREAAIDSGFSKKEDLYAWLERATGPHLKYLEHAVQHTRRAMELCPLQGQAYLYMSEMAFLELAGADARDELIAQALLVRPYHPRILYEAGREALIAGHTENAIELWASAFERSVPFRDKIIRQLAPNVAAQFFLNYFDPDWDALHVIGNHYRGLKRTFDLESILRAHAQESIRLAKEDGQDSEQTMQYWMAAYRDYAEIDDQVRVRQALEGAIEADPNAYFPREAYGKWLYDKQLFAEAADHLMWCAQRKPNDKRIASFAEYVRKRALVDIGRTADTNGAARPNSQATESDAGSFPIMAAEGDEPEVSL